MTSTPRSVLGSLAALVCAGSLVIPRAQVPPQPTYTFEGTGEADRFGASVAGAGDVDGDGFPDVIAGAPHADKRGISSGLARVFSGRDGSELHLFLGDAESDWFGFSVSGAGDIDGDGCADVLVGSPSGTPSSGGAYLYSGRTGRLLRSWSGAAPGDRFGQSVCGIGDADGDGVGDVAIGAPNDDAAGANAGCVEVFSGRSGESLVAFRGAAWDFLGYSVGAAGDVDGDGSADVVAGAPFADVGAFNAGAAFVISGRTGIALRAFHGAHVGDQLGSSVGGAGDVDGDGTPDIVLGIPGADAGGIDSGAAEVRSGASGALLLAILGSSAGEGLGAVAGAGDVDGDGHGDVIVGSASARGSGPESGRARIVSGRTGRDIAVFEGKTASDWFGAAVAAVGDVDRDGRIDVAVGAPGHDDDVSKKGYVHVLASMAAGSRR